MIKEDIAVLNKLFPKDEWQSVTVSVQPRCLDEAMLEALLADPGLRFGWVVQTGAVLRFDGNRWCTKRCDVIETPWRRLLHAELAFDDDKRGARVTLLRGTQWLCDEVREGGGQECLATHVSHFAAWGGRKLNYRVYWGLRPTMDAPGQPQCYQPIASRLLAAGG